MRSVLETRTARFRNGRAGSLPTTLRPDGKRPKDFDPIPTRTTRRSFDKLDRSVTTWDDYEMFNGSPERYDWTLVGTTEMYVPYNNYRAVQPEYSYDDLLTPHHLNPEPLRYELHRVWVVEATVKQGARHRYAKRRFYLDEDSWLALATEKCECNR